MFRFFRNIGQQLFKQGNLKKYLGYALGEIFLVVLGILIALQINNANQKKIEQRELQAQLLSISKNIESDLKKARIVNEKHKEVIAQMNYVYSNLMGRLDENPDIIRYISSNISKEDVAFVGELLQEIWRLSYLNSNTSGFMSLQNSGYLSKLQGTDLGFLLSDYYNLVQQIALEENNYNERVKQARADFLNQDFEGLLGLFQTDWLPDGAINSAYRSLFKDIITSNAFNNFVFLSYEELVLNYENLIIMGQELVRMIENDLKQFDDTSQTELDKIYDKYANVGYPKIISNGFSTPFYSILDAFSNYGVVNQMGFAQKGYSEIHFPGMEWAVTFFFVGTGTIDALETRDFSSYNTMRLELKGSKGGESFEVTIKDETNPTDGTEQRFPISLTNEWQTIEIPLETFDKMDLTKIFMPLAFVFQGEPMTIQLKSVEYIK